MLITALFITAKNWIKSIYMSPADKWITDHMYKATKRNTVLTYNTIQRNTKNTVLSEQSKL